MCLSTTGLGSRATNHDSNFLPKIDYGQTRPSTLERDYKPQHDFSGSLRLPHELGINLQVQYPKNPQTGRSSSNSIDERSDTTYPGFHPTPSSQSLQHEGRSNTQAQQREYYPNPAQQPPHLCTTTPFMTATVPDDLYDFTSNEFDFLAMNDESMAIYQGNSGLHLGYDVEHDWSEGAQTQLFGDFFFGGAGNSANAGQ